MLSDMTNAVCVVGRLPVPRMAGSRGPRLTEPEGCTQRRRTEQGSTPQSAQIRQWVNGIEGSGAVPKVDWQFRMVTDEQASVEDTSDSRIAG